MTNVRMINSTNSIQEVVFRLQLDSAMNEQTVNKLQSLKKNLKKQLPKAEDLRSYTFAIENSEVSAQTSSKNLVGIMLQDVEEDGKIKWLVRAEHNFITVNCLDY
jgi:uncharacterized protein (TIGR04255 family)